MRRIYWGKNSREFWEEYWSKVGRETDRILDSDIYPYNPTLRYIKEGMKILELGCGMGRIYKPLFHDGFDIVGIERDRQAAEELKRENSTFRIIHGDAERLPFQSNVFDMILAFGVVGNIEEGPDQIFSQINRVLRDGGVLICSLKQGRFNWMIFGFLQFLRRWRPRATEREQCFRCHVFDMSEVVKIIEKHGRRLLEIMPILLRAPLYMNAKILRSSKTVDLSRARADDKFYNLNLLGEFIFKLFKRFFPWIYADAMVIVCQKNVHGL